MRIEKGKKQSARRTLLYGPHGVGKTTWAANAPQTLVMNIEDGCDDIDCSRSELIVTYDQLMDNLRWLYANKHDFKTIAIDTVDWLERLIHAEIAKRNKKDSIADIGYGAGYKQALALWSDIVGALDWLRREKGIAIILLAHADIKKFQSPEAESYDRYMPALHDTASALLQEWCDEVLFASYRVFTSKEDLGYNRERTIARGAGDRYIRCNESAAVIAKNRLGMPDEIEFSWGAYEKYQGDIAGVVKDGSSKKKEVK